MILIVAATVFLEHIKCIRYLFNRSSCVFSVVQFIFLATIEGFATVQTIECLNPEILRDLL